MMPRAWLGALLGAATLLAVNSALACPPLPADAAAPVRQAAAAIDDAVRSADRAALERSVARSFEQILGNGERVDRKHFIDALAQGPGVQFTVRNLRVCGWPDVAVVSFDADFTAGEGSDRRVVSTFMVDLYKRETQRGRPRWVLAFEQIGVRR
jgi:hypothetical protein